jgi:hypothetical protein
MSEFETIKVNNIEELTSGHGVIIEGTTMKNHTINATELNITSSNMTVSNIDVTNLITTGITSTTIVTDSIKSTTLIPNSIVYSDSNKKLSSIVLNSGEVLCGDINNVPSAKSIVGLNGISVNSDPTNINISIDELSVPSVGGLNVSGLLNANGGINGALNGSVGSETPNTGSFTTLSTISNTNIGGLLTVTGVTTLNDNLTISNTNGIIMRDDNNTYDITLKGPLTLTNTSTFRLPRNEGTDGQVLFTNVGGETYWGTPSGGDIPDPLHVNTIIPNTGTTVTLNGSLNVNNNIVLFKTSTTLDRGVIYTNGTAIDTNRFISNPGSANTFVGEQSGNLLISSNGNTCIGYQSGYILTTGNSNACLGSYSGYRLTTGNSNACLGSYSGYMLTTGNYNICLGYYSGYMLTTGGSNICIGAESGINLSGAGSQNICIGNLGASTDQRIIRIGTAQTNMYLPDNIEIGPTTSSQSLKICTNNASSLILGKSGTPTTINGILNANGNITTNTNKFTVNSSSGETTINGTLNANGDVKVNTNKFTVNSTTGDTTISGQLYVTNKISYTSGIIDNGSIVLKTPQILSGAISENIGFNFNETSSYSVGDLIFIDGGNNGCIKVLSVNNGVVNGIEIINCGYNYTSGTKTITTNGNGVGGHVIIIATTNTMDGIIYSGAQLNNNRFISNPNGNIFIGKYSGNIAVTGVDNICLGNYSGPSLTSGNNNIMIGLSAGDSVSSASDGIYIGSSQTSCYIAGIYGKTPQSVTSVFINSDGKLGSAVSSRRYKTNINDMEDYIQRLNVLHPVNFTYKSDETNTKQVGLIAEEVHEVLPEFVVYNKEGLPDGVQYHNLPVVLLQYVQQQNKEIIDLKSRLAIIEAKLNHI